MTLQACGQDPLYVPSSAVSYISSLNLTFHSEPNTIQLSQHYGLMP